MNFLAISRFLVDIYFLYFEEKRLKFYKNSLSTNIQKKLDKIGIQLKA